MGDPVLVTGGSGFIGGAIVRGLVESGRRVRALARSDAAARAVEELGAEPVHGDVLDAASLAGAMDGCAVAFHAAGVNALCLRDPRPMFLANVVGSRNVVEAAAGAGLRRVVYTSSAATIGEPSGETGREDLSHRGTFLSNYERSKVLAERALLEASRRLAVEVVCVNPASVQGPGRAGGTARLMLAVANGRLPFLVDAMFGIVDVADCTEGHLRAEDRGRPGERYVLCGAVLTTRQAVEVLSRVGGIRPRVAWLPRPLAAAGAAAVEVAARVGHRDPPVCREMIRTLAHGHRYDGSKAAAELGLTYTPVEETLRRSLSWFRDQGLLRRPLPGLDARGGREFV